MLMLIIDAYMTKQWSVLLRHIKVQKNTTTKPINQKQYKIEYLYLILIKLIKSTLYFIKPIKTINL